MKRRRKIKYREPEVAKNTAPSRVQRKSSALDSNLSFDTVGYLPRTMGNAAVQRMLKTGVIQAKLKIGKSNNIYEQEADRVAEQVSRKRGSDSAQKQTDRVQLVHITHIDQNQLEKKEIQANSNFYQVNSLVQRQDEDEEELQLKSSEERSQGLSSDAENQIQSLEGRGSPLPDSVREFLELRFDKDLSAVRIHHNSDANEMARDVNAKVFTFGRNVVFGAGGYEPNKNESLGLIAHELTHVVQQNDVRTGRTKGGKKEKK